MSSVQDVERAVADPEARREALNPFDGCPWEEFLNASTHQGSV